ncbi:hypothetical protein N0V93_005619 [Gnomoniopsis smithogilvyi]|uniref:Carboxylesterase type B domain-containing protein n=1 Tax=Gnomoniopsis smithogilvyi TaxID=1191159 RepID=A0A9W9CY78_9PEZI|nr:hypothetical protein N0V93_005619 [Gnomoniopsis smithogilvyi]
MATRLVSLSLLLGVGALGIGLIAIFLQPIQTILIQVSSKSGIELPLGFTSPTIVEVFDAEREVRYVGKRAAASDVEHFQNIFYAEDTSGQNRFAPPVPTTPAKGSVIDATLPGAWCPQGTGDVLPFTSRVTNVSENCLSLRIARPRGTQSDARLPVMVWLHGGGHALGSAYEMLYEPDGLVKQAAVDGQPLIFVAINYRLGLFGFATSKALIEAKHTNAGLRDQRAALEWVQDNIETFGGDPGRVTAIGQSVGASDISLQLSAFAGQQGVPFQQAVMMSGAAGLNFNTMSDLVQNNTAAVAHEAGCIQNGNSQSQETLQCLREADVNVLTNLSVTAMRSARPPFGEGFFYPTYDNDFLPDRPSQLVRAGKIVPNIPVIASWVTNDGAWYAPPTTASDEDVLASFGLWLTGLSETTKKSLLELYPVSDFAHMVRPDYDGPLLSPQYYRAAQLNRDLWFTCPVLDFAWQYRKQRSRSHSSSTAEVRLYEHNATRFTAAYEAMGVPMWRVAHLSDIPYVLNTQQLAGMGIDNSAAQRAQAEYVCRNIARFVTSGMPEDAAWSDAFTNATEKELLEGEFPRRLGLQLFGGPHGNVQVALRAGDESAGSEAELAVRNWGLMVPTA